MYLLRLIFDSKFCIVNFRLYEAHICKCLVAVEFFCHNIELRRILRSKRRCKDAPILDIYQPLLFESV